MSSNQMTVREVPPDPSRMSEGLRDTGYSFETAVADLVDNSIAAMATEIRIDVQMDYAGEITLMIADNGIGMDESGLLNAMKYGSARRSNPRSLGKFGLGLKTASTAFGRRLSVISCPKGNNQYLKAVWDLDHIAKVERWELFFSSPDENELAFLKEVAGEDSGTLVVWEKIDRLLKEYTDPAGGYARKSLDAKIKNLSEHLSMIYQRFLDGNDTREPQKAIIWLNDQKLMPWDPFCVQESEMALEKTMPVSLDRAGDSPLGEFTVRAFILPRKEEFSNPEAATAARLSNDLQGFYIYRENRLIHYADWLAMWVQEPHFSLLRVEFSFDARLDEAFQVDIKKSKITLNETLYRWLKDNFLPPARRAAEDRYRRGSKKIEKNKAAGAHGASNTAIGNREKDIKQADVKIIDAGNNLVEVTNPYGKTRLILKLDHAGASGELFVKPVDSIEDGLLWQPALIDGNLGIELNTGHQFYRKVYLPEILSSHSSVATVQGIDALIWALGVSELNAVNEETKSHFQDLRYDISRTLKKLVEHLPEPPESKE